MASAEDKLRLMELISSDAVEHMAQSYAVLSDPKSRDVCLTLRGLAKENSEVIKANWDWSKVVDLVRTDLSTAAARAEKAERERDEAIRCLSEATRKQGEAEGKLAMSETAGIVEGWIDRAEKAEAERDAANAELARLRESVVVLTEDEFAKFEMAIFDPPKPTEALIELMREGRSARSAQMLARVELVDGDLPPPPKGATS